MSKSIVSICAFLLCFNSLFSQNFEVGLTLGSTLYTGDIDVVPQNMGSAMRPAFGILGKYRLFNSLLLRGQVITGKLSGSEKKHPETWRQGRGYAFETQLTEVSALAEWESVNNGRFAVFVFGGGAATFFTPKADFNIPNKYVPDINPDVTTSYKKMTLAIPMGIGVNYALPNDFFIGAEFGYRLAFSDYLDGLSKVANPKQDDAYYYLGLTVTKAFGVGKSGANRRYKSGSANCPKF